MSDDNGYSFTGNTPANGIGETVHKNFVANGGQDTNGSLDTYSHQNTNKNSQNRTDKENNKSTPGESDGATTRSRSLQSLPRSERSSGRERVRIANPPTAQHKAKDACPAESHNPAGFIIRIGGKTYTYKEPRDRQGSIKSSTKSLKSVSSTQKSSGFPSVEYGQRPTISSVHGINYLSKEKPFLGLETIRALNSAYPFGRVQNDSYPYTLPVSTSNGQHRSEMRSSSLAGDLCQVFSVFFAILVRAVLAAFSVATVYVVVDKRNDERFWGLTSILSLFVIEGVYTVVKRRGQERKWISLCFFCYLLATLPSVWLLELQKLGLFESKYADLTSNGTSIGVAGFDTTITLSSDDLIFVLENCMVFLLILCRWLLPRGDISRDQLSQLLFVFIGMGSDVMELFQLFEEEEVKKRRNLAYIILAVWSLSLFQFTLVLTMSASPKKARVALNSNTQTEDSPNATRRDAASYINSPKHAGFVGRPPVRRRRTFKEFLVYSEVWSLIVTIFMQDGPYLAVRLYVVIELSIINSNIIFFVCKNAIVICLLIYRLIVVGLRVSEDNDGDSDDGMEFLFRDRLVNAYRNGDIGEGGHWEKIAQAIPTVSGRSVVTDMTNLTPASTNARPAKQKSTNATDSSHSDDDETPSTGEPAPSPKDERLAGSGSAPSVGDEGFTSGADSASVTVDENPIIGTPSLSHTERHPVSTDNDDAPISSV